MKGLVWGLHFEDGCRKLEWIIQNYVSIGYEPQIRRSKSEFSVSFDNGDYWKICRIQDCARGNKVNISYIDHRIPQEIVNTIIRPCTIALPYQGLYYF